MADEHTRAEREREHVLDGVLDGEDLLALKLDATERAGLRRMVLSTLAGVPDDAWWLALAVLREEAQAARGTLRARARRVVAYALLRSGVLLVASGLVGSDAFGANDTMYTIAGYLLTSWIAVFVVLVAYRWRRMQAAEARYAAAHDEHERTVLPLVRDLYNVAFGLEFSREVRLADITGLEDLFDASYEVETCSGDEFTATLRRLRAGSIGLFGPRGAGKSTLMEAARHGRLDWQRGRVIGITVPAPVSYDPKEFIPFLFARLCLAAIEPHREPLDRIEADAREATLRVAQMAALIVAGAAAVFWARDDFDWKTWSVGTLLFVAAALVALPARPARALRRIHRGDPLLAIAERDLDDLRYLETTTSERSAELGAKAAKVGRKLGTSRARQALTLPEVTERYREFLRAAVGNGRAVVVGIDELDKMTSPEEAAAFLNAIKALFGQPGVYYLVSLSEDAAASFEQRGAGVRDVFESVFDQVVLVEPLRPDESRTLLRRRILGLRPPFAELCHVISGGLPRELIRCAREAAAVAQEAGTITVGELASRVLVARGIARERAVMSVAARHVGRDGIQPVLTWLRDLGPSPDAAELLRRCAELPAFVDREPAVAPELDAAVLGLVAWWYHAATVMELAAGLDDVGLKRHAGAIELLARGYLDLAIAPSLAWDTIDQARDDLGLTPARYPLSGEAGAREPIA
jgi:hypothetical protein